MVVSVSSVSKSIGVESDEFLLLVCKSLWDLLTIMKLLGLGEWLKGIFALLYEFRGEGVEVVFDERHCLCNNESVHSN